MKIRHGLIVVGIFLMMGFALPEKEGKPLPPAAVYSHPLHAY